MSMTILSTSRRVQSLLDAGWRDITIHQDIYTHESGESWPVLCIVCHGRIVPTFFNPGVRHITLRKPITFTYHV